MKPQEFVDQLKEVFWNKNKLLQFNPRQQDSIFDTIKAFLQKKNLIIVSRVEYENTLKACQNSIASEIISEVLFEELAEKIMKLKDCPESLTYEMTKWAENYLTKNPKKD